MRILVVRPEPGAAATAARLRALGHTPVAMPLFATEALDWALPAVLPDGVIFTSAAGVRHAGPQADALKALPALCVGEATAAAARAAGWPDVAAGPGTVKALLDAAGPHRRLLHLAGADRTPATVPAGLNVEVVTVYHAVPTALPNLPDVAAVLLHSPRAARHFAAEWDRLGGRRADITLYAISSPTLAAASDGWRHAHAAAQPSEDALLAMLPEAL